MKKLEWIGESDYDLYPCPFCASEGEFMLDNNLDILVMCKGCGARGGPSDEAEGAASLWNMMAEVPQRDRKVRFYKEWAERSSKNEIEAYRETSKAMVRAQRIDKHNRSLIKTHNALMGRIDIAIEMLEKRLNQKPKHLLTRGADGKLVGDDRDTIMKVISTLRPEPEQVNEEDE